MMRRHSFTCLDELTIRPSEIRRRANSIPPSFHRGHGSEKLETAGNDRKRKALPSEEQLCDIKTSRKIAKRRGGGAVLSIEVRSLRFVGLENTDEPLPVVIPRLLNKFILTTLTEHGLDPETAKFCISLSHKEIDSGFFFKFQNYETLNGEAIYQRLRKFAQSSKVVNIDSELSIEMHVHTQENETCNAPLLPGQGGKAEAYLDEPLKVRAYVKNSDNLCLARAFVIAKQYGDLQEEKKNGKNVSDMEKMLRRILANEKLQKYLAELLLKNCGIPIEKEYYTTKDLDILATHHTDYRIALYTREFGHKVYSIAENCEWNPTGRKTINMVFRNFHYDAFQPTRTSIGATICLHCSEPYKKFEIHRCPYLCKYCHTAECQKGTLMEKRCEDCNVFFSYELCYKRHKASRGNQEATEPKRRGSKRLKSLCERFKTCLTCNKYYREENVKAKGHTCNTRWCPQCKQYAPVGHECAWPPPTPEQRQQARKKQGTFKIISYDFETVQIDELPEGGDEEIENFNEEHFANIVCWNKFCQDCADKDQELPCDNCGVKRGNFKYLDKDDDKWAVIDNFIDFLLFDPSNNNATLFAHNAACFDVHFFLRRLFAKKVLPEVICNGNKIMLMKIKPSCVETPLEKPVNSLTFKDSFLLIPQPLASLPQAFGIENTAKGTFPYLFNMPRNYGKVFPSLPDKAFYNAAQMKPAELAKFDTWYEENKNQAFDFDQEILRYCEMDVEILRSSLIAYMKAFLELTTWNPLVQATTYASFSMFVLRMDSLREGQVGILPENGYMNGDTQSEMALKYIQWLEYIKNIEFEYKLKGGEIRINTRDGQYKVDAYHRESNTVLEILGCWYHGCRQCTNPHTTHALFNITMDELAHKTAERLEDIKAAGYNVEVIYEHEIKQLLRQNKEMREFFDNCRFLSRLQPRDAFLGGRTQPFRMLAQENLEKGETLQYFDFVSLYPWVTSRVAEYPTGQPEVITKDFETFVPGRPISYRGLIKCKVLAPRGMLYPIIGQRLNGKLILANCRSCAESMNNGECNHEDIEERAFVTTVCDYELRVALSEGYQILEYFEVWHWQRSKWERGGLFKSFTDKFLIVKQEASGWPSECVTEQERSDYLEEIEKNVGIKLDPARIQKNIPLRIVSKLCLNSSWGKLGEKPGKSQVHFVVCSSAKFAKLIADDTQELVNIVFVTDDTAMLIMKPVQEFVQATKYTNVAYASITTATARIQLWKALNKIGDRCVYCDTDSVVFIHKRGEYNLEDMMGDYLGRLQSEIPANHRMIEFVSIAPKVYSYILENAAGERKTVLKVKGVTLDNEAVKQINHEVLKKMVEKSRV